MYKLTTPGVGVQVVIRLPDGLIVPLQEGNADYVEYQAWLAAGNTPDPVTPPTREQKIADIDAQRDVKLAAGVTWNTHLWHTDNDFQTQITALISAFNNGIIPAGTSVKVRTKDNGAILLTLDDLKSLATAVLQYVQGVYDWSWTEKDKL